MPNEAPKKATSRRTTAKKETVAEIDQNASALDAAPTPAVQTVTDPEKAELLAETTPKSGQTSAAAARASVIDAAPVVETRDRSLDAAPVAASGNVASDFAGNAQAAPAGRDTTKDAAPVAYLSQTAPKEDDDG